MSSSTRQCEPFGELEYRCWRLLTYRRTAFACLLILAALGLGCSVSTRSSNANSNNGSVPAANSNGNASADSRAARSAPLDIKEPERYSVAMTISVQDATADPAKMPTLQFDFTKIDADRRWAFALPSPLGQVVYLEKSGLRYLILFERKQYIEVSSGELGFAPGNSLTAGAVAGHLKERVEFESLGVELVNARTARKYRFEETGNAVARADGAIYVDMETGLPVRSEVNMAASEGGKVRVIVEARDLQLNPDRLLFDVPDGMRKVSAQEAKQQIQSVSAVLRSFAEMTTGSPPTSFRNMIPPGANNNASRAERPRR